MKKITRVVLISTLTTLVGACSGFFDKDNTPTPSPLVKFTPEAKPRLLWSSHVSFGTGDDFLKLIPAVTDRAIFTVDRHGVICATDKTTGSTLWRETKNISISAGPAVDQGLVFVGSRKGHVFAMQQTDGKTVWEAEVASEILSPPAADHGIVLVKTIDGQLTALAENDGHVLWRYQQIEPALILRSGSTPQFSGDHAVVGFANGNLAKLTLNKGNLVWQSTIAMPQGSFAIQRMVDIDADPMVYNNQIYVATYQGKIASLDSSSGRDRWTHDISSFTGLTADGERVYVSDATSELWAFDADTGTVDWRQTQLTARNITGPVTMGNMVVVGDSEGYVHWMSKQDGHFIARARYGYGMLATPVTDGQTLYIFTRDGHLAAYQLS